MTIPVDLKQIDELVERLRSYAASLDALRRGVSLDESQRLANVTPALSARAMTKAADTIEAQASLIDDLKVRLRMIVSHASGGALSKPGDTERSINDICVEISRHHNRVWEHAQETARKEVAKLKSLSEGGE